MLRQLCPCWVAKVRPPRANTPLSIKAAANMATGESRTVETVEDMAVVDTEKIAPTPPLVALAPLTLAPSRPSLASVDSTTKGKLPVEEEGAKALGATAK